nr:translational initiation factor 1 [Hypecoum zhukanum]WCF60166.1 translational initiation factor 1 [Hypecoum zhukanum]
MFRIRLDIEDLILGYVSGRIRRSFSTDTTKRSSQNRNKSL